MDFIVAASNLRAYMFRITGQYIIHPRAVTDHYAVHIWYIAFIYAPINQSTLFCIGSRDTTFVLDILKSIKVPEFVPKSGET
jgi:hypothetical protein